MQEKLIRLSRTISHALRHAPWLYELELDEEGWVEVEALLSALRSHRREWRHLTQQDLIRVMENSDKQRFEMRGNLFRALYGHSTPQRLQKVPSEPPVVLYHANGASVRPPLGRPGNSPAGRPPQGATARDSTSGSSGGPRRWRCLLQRQ
jgi:putative RNA 2'-phosphotransferase